MRDAARDGRPGLLPAGERARAHRRDQEGHQRRRRVRPLRGGRALRGRHARPDPRLLRPQGRHVRQHPRGAGHRAEEGVRAHRSVRVARRRHRACRRDQGEDGREHSRPRRRRAGVPPRRADSHRRPGRVRPPGGFLARLRPRRGGARVRRARLHGAQAPRARRRRPGGGGGLRRGGRAFPRLAQPRGGGPRGRGRVGRARGGRGGGVVGRRARRRRCGGGDALRPRYGRLVRPRAGLGARGGGPRRLCRAERRRPLRRGGPRSRRGRPDGRQLRRAADPGGQAQRSSRAGAALRGRRRGAGARPRVRQGARVLVLRQGGPPPPGARRLLRAGPARHGAHGPLRGVRRRGRGLPARLEPLRLRHRRPGAVVPSLGAPRPVVSAG